MIHVVKRTLYRVLGLNGYLSLVQRLYLLAYRSGMLKNNPSYRWHYFVKNLVGPDDVVVDIGANLGYFAAAFLPLLGEKGRLYCVEPVAPYRKQLQKITGKRENATVFPFALGDENKDVVQLGMPPALHHLGYLRHGTVTISQEDTGAKSRFSFECPLRHAGEVFADFSRIDYIKCDIEGYETVVFPAMQDVIIRHQPLVQLETWGKQLPIMLSFFADLGYLAYQLQDGKLINSKRLPAEMLGTSDILFVPPSKNNKIAAWVSED